ncbi:unnamed protein product [Ectocarpus sp. 12 AP-2014]
MAFTSAAAEFRAITADPAGLLQCISSTSALDVGGVQPPVEPEDDGQEPWLARGTRRTLQQVSWEADPADHGGLGVELPRSPGAVD